MSLRSELAFDRASTAKTGLVTELFAFDRSSARSFDIDGRMRVDVCNISKATVNPYYGREIPGFEKLGLDADKFYRLYRAPEELAKAAPTFRGVQLLDDHVPVDARNPKMDRTAGAIGTEVRFEHPYLKAPLVVWTQAAIDAILAKKSAQLSCSYRYRPDMTPGTSPEGLEYDGVMRDIMANHVALVRAGRAGPDVYVSDSLPIEFEESMAYKYPKTVAVAAKVFSLTAAQQIAFDAELDKEAKDSEMDKEEAMDAREAAMDEREAAMDAEAEKMDAEKKDEVARGDRKKARDARAKDRAARDSKRAADKAARDKAAKDEPPKAADKLPDLSKYVTADAAAKLAKDAADAAVAAERAYESAKREVLPLVGPIKVAMDSAEAVYRFALDAVKVPHKDIHASALPAVVAAEARTRAVRPAASPAPLAADGSVVSIDSIFRAA